MNKFIRNNQKKLLAIFSALLMIIFMLPSSFRNSKGEPGDRVVGMMGDVKVTSGALNAAQQEWQDLSKLIYRDPNQKSRSQQYRLVDAELWQGPANEIDRQPDTFFFLLQEAKKEGVVISGEEMQSVLKNNIENVSDDEEMQQQYAPAVSDLLMVRDLLQRQRDVVKISRPRIDLQAANILESVAINVLSFRAEDYFLSTPMPTPAEIEAQYNNFKTFVPGVFGVPHDDLEFGYTYPDRVKLQYIGLDAKDLHRAVLNSKAIPRSLIMGDTKYEASIEPQDTLSAENYWLQAAFAEFKKNRDYYDTQEVEVPSTQPATQSTTLASGAVTRPSSQPSTVMRAKELADLAADFELHQTIVLKMLYEDESEKLANRVLKKISDTMKTDMAAWTDAQKGKGPTTRPNSSLGPPFDSMEYIAKLKDVIEKQFDVYLVRGEVTGFESEGQLAGVERIGKSEILMNNQQSLPFYRYATAVVGLRNGTVPFALQKLQMSSVLHDGDDLFQFRVTDIDPSHVASLDEVRDQVIKDWRTNNAYEQAKAAAYSAYDKAKASGLAAAAEASGRPEITTTEVFFPDKVYRGGDKAEIKPLKLKAASAMELAHKADALLITAPPGPGLRPMDMVELPADGQVVIIELDKSTSSAPSGDFDMIQASIATEMVQSEANTVATQLARYDTVTARMNYKKTEKQ